MTDMCPKCGRIKSCNMPLCGVCTLQKQYSGEGDITKIISTGTAVTSGHCKEHNSFFTVPGGSCPDCGPDWQEGACERITRILTGEASLPQPQQSARHNAGKVQLREVDPDFILGIGEVLTASREFYEEGNWMRETKFSTPYESCQRHLLKFWNGDDLDEQTKKSHLLHAATNLMFLYYHLSSGVGVDDRLFKKKDKSDE